MRKSILRFIILAVLISVCAVTLIACESKIDRELREMEETHNAISDLAREFGIELPEFGDTSGSVTITPDEKQPEEYVINSNFTLLPIEIIRDPETNLNRHIGKRYYVHAVMIGDYFSGDGFDLYELFLSHEGLADVDPDVDGWEYFFALSLAVTPEQVDWEDTVYSEEHIYYFEYLGYDDEARKHLGKYVSHSPWSRQR